MEASDWVAIGIALFLGTCALLAPYVSEIIKRKWFSPELLIEFALGRPLCHLTRSRWLDKKAQTEVFFPVYYFRFRVKNDGHSVAKNCEARLEELWIVDSSGTAIKKDGFWPANLAIAEDNPQKDINPGRTVIFNIGHISSPECQKEYEKSISLEIDESDKRLRFTLAFPTRYYAQLDSLLPYEYILKIAAYCESSRVEQLFGLSWSGLWKETEEEMFREIVIRRL